MMRIDRIFQKNSSGFGKRGDNKPKFLMFLIIEILKK